MKSILAIKRRKALGIGVLIVVSVLLTPIAVIQWKLLEQRAVYVAWDFGTIEERWGGEGEEDRFLKLEFLKEWEYRGLKKMPNGETVWIYFQLSKRHCGNWGLMDPSQQALIRPFDLRYPHGPPPKRPGSVNCFGMPST